jgi:hypothetical protein
MSLAFPNKDGFVNMTEEHTMNYVSTEIHKFALGLSLLTALSPAYSENLSKQCTEELGGKSVKLAIVVHQDGKEYDPKNSPVEYYFPYGVNPYYVPFPLKVKDIAGPPEVITLTPYHASPVSYMVCWWSGGAYKCI